MPDKDDLSVLIPTPTVVQAGGERVEIAPLTLGELPAILGALRAAGPLESLEPTALLTQDPDLAARLLALLTRRDVAWLKSLPLDEAAGLLLGALEANQSFFTRSGPALMGLVARMIRPAGG